MLASSTWRGELTGFRFDGSSRVHRSLSIVCQSSSGNMWSGSTVTEAIPDLLSVVQVYALLMRDGCECAPDPVQQQSGEASESHDQHRDKSNHNPREHRRRNRLAVRVAYIYLLEYLQIVVERNDAHRNGQADQPQQAGVREVRRREKSDSPKNPESGGSPATAERPAGRMREMARAARVRRGRIWLTPSFSSAARTANTPSVASA